MIKLPPLFLFLFINTNLYAQSLRRPIGAAYIGLGAYNIHHVDAFSFTANQAALVQIKSAAIGIYGEQRFY